MTSPEGREPMVSPEGREMIDRFRRELRDDDHRAVLWAQMQRRIAAEAPAPARRGTIVIATAILVAAAAALVLWMRPEPRAHAVAAPGEQAVDRAVGGGSEAATHVAVPVPAELPSPPRAAATPMPASPPTLQRPTASPANAVGSDDDPFAREVAMIRGAREAALRGDWDAVATLLDRHAQAFPAGALRRERMTLAIDRSCAQGEPDRALDHARRLLAAFPADATAQRRASTPCPTDSVTKPAPSGQ